MDNLEKGAWVAVALFAGLDTLTTLYGLSLGLMEANPIAAYLFTRAGPIAAMTALKVLAVLVAWAGRHFVEARHPSKTWVPPALLATVWALVSFLNYAHAHAGV